MIKISNIIILSIVLNSCSGTIQNQPIFIDWAKVYTFENDVEFCQLDNISSGFDLMLSYSFSSSVGGGYRIVGLGLKNDSINSIVLKAHEKATSSFLYQKANKILFIEDNFEKNILNTTLYLSDDGGKHWRTVNTPIEGLRKCIYDEVLLVEGNIGGTGQLFILSKCDTIWHKLNFDQTYKSFLIADKIDNENTVLCIGAHEYNYRNCDLVALNTINGSIVVILKNIGEYIKPITKHKNTFAVLVNRKIKIYSYIDMKSKKLYNIKIPAQVSHLQNLYLGDDFQIITYSNKGKTSKPLSWISYDNGKSWAPFEQGKALRLVYNSNGDLYGIDDQNNLLKNIEVTKQ